MIIWARLFRASRVILCMWVATRLLSLVSARVRIWFANSGLTERFSSICSAFAGFLPLRTRRFYFGLTWQRTRKTLIFRCFRIMRWLWLGIIWRVAIMSIIFRRLRETKSRFLWLRVLFGLREYSRILILTSSISEIS